MNIEDEILGNPILREVKGLLENQTAKGLAKYGTTVNPYDYTFDEWIRHAQEECMDLLVYLTLLKNKNENHVSAELYEDLVSDYQKLQNENKRLRETLTEIANVDTGDGETREYYQENAVYMKITALRVLHETEESK